MQSGSRSRWTDLAEAELCQTDVSGTVRKEFQSAEFGDERLTDRLMQVGDRLGRAPAESIPNACEDWAFTKATYRFCDNERVDPGEILSAHTREQRSRVDDNEELLIVSDTTELVFPRHPSNEGLGDIGNSTTDLEGVKVHSTIGVDPQTHRMTGVIDQQSLIEDQQASTKHDANGKGERIELESEQKKWIRGDRQASDWLAEEIRPIFIHDRGADAFAYTPDMVGSRWPRDIRFGRSIRRSESGLLVLCCGLCRYPGRKRRSLLACYSSYVVDS
jgi:hypothetical protein